MSPIKNLIINKSTDTNPIWIMRQAGRYLPEFREIRRKNPDFIKLCLNSELSKEITLQPLKRFDLDAAIIFSDILMVPYGLNQKIEFKKNFGPILGNLNLEEVLNLKEDDFVRKINPVYEILKMVSQNDITTNKSTIGFVGAPWTLLVYMINKKSPKIKLVDNFLENDIDELYDLINDPGEMNNLINDEEYETIELELRNESKRLQKKYNYNPDRDWWLKTQIRK